MFRHGSDEYGGICMFHAADNVAKFFIGSAIFPRRVLLLWVSVWSGLVKEQLVCILFADKMNQEKLAKLQAQVRIGGKGTARRKKKVVHRTATADDKKLQSSLKKLAVNNIAGIEEVNMIKDDGTVIHFNNPKVQASLSANTFAITGHAETKQLTEMLPGILSQLGADSLTSLRKLAEQFPRQVLDNKAPKAEDIDEEDDDVPDLVENFDEASKNEAN
ncbi:hypothetical protein COCON_G00088880 [Conger conger]|uniref:Transcription factor BTF3 n=1 Tax=Conger conger TaxID=82655 RepID=A0A9Q1DKR0_CONCO|nr:hypothetical protein COCON_G00088880 [Conger conger]